jgi:aquaporin Z
VKKYVAEVIGTTGQQARMTSVNPARSIGPVVFVGGQALSQLWLFLVAPLLGALIGGLLHNAGITHSP